MSKSRMVTSGRQRSQPTKGCSSYSLYNSLVTFQTMMNDILRDFIDWEVIICYMDDILIFTTTLEEHRKVVREVLETLRKRRLFLKPEKCKFEWKRIEYLGLIISEGSI